MNWDDVSDLEVSKAVAETLGYVVKLAETVTSQVWVMQRRNPDRVLSINVLRLPDFCNSWADMGPIITKNQISVYSFITYWKASTILGGMFDADHTNPLRAAAIVYLMMNGVKAEDCK